MSGSSGQRLYVSLSGGCLRSAGTVLSATLRFPATRPIGFTNAGALSLSTRSAVVDGSVALVVCNPGPDPSDPPSGARGVVVFAVPE